MDPEFIIVQAVRDFSSVEAPEPSRNGDPREKC